MSLPLQDSIDSNCTPQSKKQYLKKGTFSRKYDPKEQIAKDKDLKKQKDELKLSLQS
jgi:hypothetical protein